MLTVYTDKHRLRDAKTELYGGELVAPFECPARAEQVLGRVREVGLGDIVAPESFGLEPVLRVHEPPAMSPFWRAAGRSGWPPDSAARPSPPCGRRADVLFVSLHGDPRHAFPHFLGYEDEVGAGPGEGCNANYPMPPGTNFEVWNTALEQACGRIAQYAPDTLVVSLGVDTFEHDPISFFKLESADYLTCGARLAKLGLPTVFVMEGGYAVAEIGINTVNVLQGFEGG